MIPIVAIVGRPNVGKSSLLNRIAGRMISIVDPTPGVTRDRITAIVHHLNRYFEIVDTGGVGIVDADNLADDVEAQIRIAIEQSSLILFLLDARDGVVPLDQRVAQMLRAHSDKVMVVANKTDAAALDNLAVEFYRLGFGEPLAISALHGRGVPELLDRVAKFLADRNLGGEELADEAREPEMKIAIVGKRNAGKSTLINAIAGSPRVITSEVPGTTRDAVDVRFIKDGKTFV
ncbi:MAG: 50S ribosome-binding GTPase, partial [Phycisphaerae bacterium]|nr:50S ribosome-binding GTPase [Phycisphaerae bacterium]